MIAEVVRFGDSTPGLIEADTWVGPGSLAAARLAAGCVVESAAAVARGDDRRAVCLVRPPGHHARPDGPMGFCLFNSIAVAAANLIHNHDLSRILVVDFDVHHGNGTQEIFESDPAVAFLSIHRHPFYPGTGLARETGTGRGLGLTKNIPLSLGISRADYVAAFRNGLERLADSFRPELVLLSAGFDAHAEDPVGSLGLEVEDFQELTGIVLGVADAHADGRLVSVLEGGYKVPILAGCVAAHLETMLDHPGSGTGT